jgi:hypothetical protein
MQASSRKDGLAGGARVGPGARRREPFGGGHPSPRFRPWCFSASKVRALAGRAVRVVCLLGLCALLLPPFVGPALAASCTDAPLMLIHPEVGAPYDEAVRLIGEGLTEVLGEPIGVCALSELESRDWADRPRRVVAVGTDAQAMAERVFPNATRLPILVPALPPGADQGLSLYIEPAVVLAQLRALAPETRVLVFVHRNDLPAEQLKRAERSAAEYGLHWVPIPVGTLREAAQAVQTMKAAASRRTAVWFHRGVLTLNPDILVPPIVRLSWEAGLPVFADDADAVARGLLFALTPDYRQVGRAAAERLVEGGHGLADLQGVRRVLNRRTARAIGLAVRPGEEGRFDHVYD